MYQTDSALDLGDALWPDTLAGRQSYRVCVCVTLSSSDSSWHAVLPGSETDQEVFRTPLLRLSFKWHLFETGLLLAFNFESFEKDELCFC